MRPVRRGSRLPCGRGRGPRRVAAVQLRGDPDLGAGFQVAAVDPLQSADDRVGGVMGVFDHRADDRVDAVAHQSVPAGPQRGEGAGQGDLPGRRGVHGEPAVGGERSSGRRPERGVAGVPAGRDSCRTDAEDRGDGCCRDCCRAHGSSVGGCAAPCQRTGAVRCPGRGDPGTDDLGRGIPEGGIPRGHPGRIWDRRERVSPVVRIPSGLPVRRAAGPGRAGSECVRVRSSR